MQLGIGIGLSFSRGQFSPLRLLSGATAMVWYDPSDLTTLFQDTAGTTPVTADGQAVARMDDKSGNGFHATQATAGNCPVYRTSGGLHWLEFNGATSNRWLQTSAITTGVAKAQAFVGARKLSDAAFQAIIETSTDPNSQTGSLSVSCGALTGDASRRTWNTVLTGSVNLVAGAAIYAQPDSKVITALFDIGQAAAAAESVMRLNGVAQTLTFSGANAGTGNFGNHAVYIGRRGGAASPFTGNFYGAILRWSSSDLDANTISATERWLAAKTGVTI